MILCSHCGAANEPGTFYCRECGTELIPQGTSRPAAAPVDSALSGAPAPQVRCQKCGVLNSIQDGYCRGCGAKLDYDPRHPTNETPAPGNMPKEEKRTTAYFGTAQEAAKARLVLIKGDGADGMSYSLASKSMVAGRMEGEMVFPDDDYLSHRHAEFFFKDGSLFVRDLGSLNGIYKKIDSLTALEDGDVFLVGEQVFRYRCFEEPPLLPGFNDPADGTKHQGGAKRELGPFCVEQLLRGGQLGIVYYSQVGEMSIGREECDLNFPDDIHLSRVHAKLYLKDETCVLEDLNSRNGTFIKVKGESDLKTNDLVFVGSQLLRVEILA
ncbi:MAG: FHA domain-containing protein [Deltaproteobacteria bacterium]|nr:FHA domain-containing protein [Deltaproteobacteria bacterium]